MRHYLRPDFLVCGQLRIAESKNVGFDFKFLGKILQKVSTIGCERLFTSSAVLPRYAAVHNIRAKR